MSGVVGVQMPRRRLRSAAWVGAALVVWSAARFLPLPGGQGFDPSAGPALQPGADAGRLVRFLVDRLLFALAGQDLARSACGFGLQPILYALGWASVATLLASALRRERLARPRRVRGGVVVLGLCLLVALGLLAAQWHLPTYHPLLATVVRPPLTAHAPWTLAVCAGVASLVWIGLGLGVGRAAGVSVLASLLLLEEGLTSLLLAGVVRAPDHFWPVFVAQALTWVVPLAVGLWGARRLTEGDLRGALAACPTLASAALLPAAWTCLLTSLLGLSLPWLQLTSPRVAALLQQPGWRAGAGLGLALLGSGAFLLLLRGRSGRHRAG